MSELYWITRLEVVNVLGVVCTVISFGILAAFFIKYHIDAGFNDTEEMSKSMLYVKKASIPLIIGLLLVIFVPTKEEALLIYGVGGTIDYVKSNNKAKKLPDKVIDALDRWLDSQNKDK